jgi:uncharacterized protein YqeY
MFMIDLLIFLDHNGINQVLFGMLNTSLEAEQEMKTHKRDDLAQKERILIDIINAYLFKLFVHALFVLFV